MSWVRWLDDVTGSDVPEVGGKGANLGELVSARLPVPPGFVVVAAAHLDALDRAGVRDEVRAALAQIDPADADALARLSADLRVKVAGIDVPEETRAAILDAYARLGRDRLVAVRSSAPYEDASAASFAGMHETFTDVRGSDAVIDAVRDCWASAYTARAISYRAQQPTSEEPALAVIVQAMVASSRSGVLFTADPRSGATDRVVVEATYGLGEAIVSGAVEPDTYVVAKRDLRVLEARTGSKTFEIVRDTATGEDRSVAVDATRAGRHVLDDDELRAIVRLGLQVEEHYGTPQDVEWSIADGVTWLVQSRPITTMGATVAAPASGRILVRGMGASPGIAAGRVRVLRDVKEIGDLQTGEVLVAPMTNPDWVPALRRAAAVVTDAGGATCHAAIVTRELGVPCVVGARDATTALATGTVVTVDGTTGAVVEGDVTVAAPAAASPAPAESAAPPAGDVEPLATLVLVNLAVAERAEEVAAGPVDGVGLLRAEFLVTEALGGAHPRQVLATGGKEAFLERMTS
jgi:pyruvate,water dikinase